VNPTKDLVFDITTEDGTQKLTLAQYHTKTDLMKQVGLASVQPFGRRTLFLGTQIFSYPFEYLDKHPDKRRMFDDLESMKNKNPLKYFVPQNESVLRFLNDTEHNLKMLIAANGIGKTTAAIIDALLDICPCDPDWPIFAVHGVKFREYRGALKHGGVAIVSYEWTNHIQTIWPQVIKRWTPQEGLGAWADGGDALINWKSNPRMEIYETPIWFHACSQAQTVFESSARDIVIWDEQGEEHKFAAMNRGTRRRNGRHIFSLTPHKVEGRPDTGAGSWIQKLFTGEMTAGCYISRYSCDIFDLPDWVYSEEAKRSAKKEWEEEPIANNDIAKLREGRARLYGEFHVSGGLVFQEWDKAIHTIDDFEIPKEWTKYRYIDHGRKEPTACLWAAVSPSGDIFLYRELYALDKTIQENVKEIIKLSGNVRERIERYVDDAGIFVERYAEMMVGEKFVRTRLDSRSMAKALDDGSMTVGQVYERAGLRVMPADGHGTEHQASIAQELFKLDYERKHYATGNDGGPRIYVFKSLEKFIWEIQQYVNEEVTRKDRDSGRTRKGERPKAKNDHLMSCLLFLACDNPRFIPGASIPDHKRNEEKITLDKESQPSYSRVRDKFTGY